MAKATAQQAVTTYTLELSEAEACWLRMLTGQFVSGDRNAPERAANAAIFKALKDAGVPWTYSAKGRVTGEVHIKVVD